MKLTTCTSCHASIFFAEQDEGADIPIDRDPVQNGNITLEEPADPRDPPIAWFTMPGKGTHVSHFATCPNAAAHRKVKR